MVFVSETLGQIVYGRSVQIYAVFRITFEQTAQTPFVVCRETVLEVVFFD